MYGVTYVLARDGYSGRLTAGAVMPRKNNITIYDQVFRPTILTDGLWDQVRVDNGREFYLVLFMQEKLRSQRGDLTVAPYRQTSSRANHIIDRRVELNHRVSYPIKRVVSLMVETDMLDMDCEIVRFCVSTLLITLCGIGVQRFMDAWNWHHLPSRGIPNILQSFANGTTTMHTYEVPSTEQAVFEYRQQGGSLSDPDTFGSDPLQGDDVLSSTRDELFSRRMDSSFSEIYSQLIIGNTVPFESAVLDYVTITQELSP